MKKLRIDLYKSYKQVPAELIDPLSLQMACLDIECEALDKQLGLAANYALSAEMCKEDMFGVNATIHSMFFVMRDKGILVGYAIIRHAGAGISVQSLYIRPEYRGHGNGRFLLERVLFYLRRYHKKKSVVIGVIANNIKALALYQSLGFIVPTHLTLMLKQISEKK